MKKLQLPLLCLLFAFSIASCKRKFEPINFGHEQCAHCRMTIMDKRFAAEIVTGKGKVYKFDDFGCLLKWVKDENFTDSGALLFVADFSHPENALDARQAIFIHNEALRSPMNGNLAASSKQEADELVKTVPGQLLTWTDVNK